MSAAESIGKFGLGLGAGLGLYLLISGLGLGRGSGRGLGGGEIALPKLPPDPQRLEFVMVGPTTPGDAVLRFRGPDGQIYSIDEMIARVRAGSRGDVTLRIRGDVISGPAAAAEAAIERAGLVVWKSAPPARPIVGRGVDRGVYR